MRKREIDGMRVTKKVKEEKVQLKAGRPPEYRGRAAASRARKEGKEREKSISEIKHECTFEHLFDFMSNRGGNIVG